MPVVTKLPDHRRNVALAGVAKSAVEAIGRDDRTTSDTRGASAYPMRPGELHAINPFSVSRPWVTLIVPLTRKRAVVFLPLLGERVGVRGLPGNRPSGYAEVSCPSHPRSSITKSRFPPWSVRPQRGISSPRARQSRGERASPKAGHMPHQLDTPRRCHSERSAAEPRNLAFRSCFIPNQGASAENWTHAPQNWTHSDGNWTHSAEKLTHRAKNLTHWPDRVDTSPANARRRKLDTSLAKVNTLPSKVNTFGRKVNTSAPKLNTLALIE